MISIDTNQIKNVFKELNSKNNGKGYKKSYEDSISEINSAAFSEYGVTLSKSILLFCRDNFKEISPAIPPLLADIINKRIIKAIDENEKNISILNPDGLYNLLSGIEGENVKVDIDGNAGGTCGSYSSGLNVTINGFAGRYLGDNSYKGLFIVKGDADEGLGLTNSGTNYFVFGKTLSRTFVQARAGTAVIVNGLGEYSGLYMASGVLVCLDGKIGNYIGNAMVGGSIYIPGKSVNEKTVGKGVTLAEKLQEEDYELLRNVFRKYASVENFRINDTNNSVIVSEKEYFLSNLVKIVPVS